MKRYLQKVVFYDTGIDWEKAAEESAVFEEGVLYVADDEQTVRDLKSLGKPVVAWLHEKNRHQDFSATAYAVERPEEIEEEFFEKIYRREVGIPWEILETKRCLVREMIPEDAESFLSIYQEPGINKYVKDFHGSLEGEMQYIREYQQQYQFFEYGVWSVVLKETGEVIGRIGFSDGKQEEYGTEDIGEKGEDLQVPHFGYVIGVPWQRQGIAYEVCKAILEYVTEEFDFQKIILETAKDNIPSQKLALKLGFMERKAGKELENFRIFEYNAKTPPVE